MSDLRERFVARFGGDLAESIEAAVEHHIQAIPGQIERGSDDFRWALVWSVGFEGLTRPDFRREHGVTTPWADLCGWLAEEADFAAYDGTMDLFGRGSGRFDLILGRRTEADEEAGWEAAEAWLLASMPAVVEA